MFELRKAVDAVLPLVANGHIGICGDGSNPDAMNAAKNALKRLKETSTAIPRNCDAYPPEKLQKQFLREQWLIDSDDKSDPIGNWTKEMLIAYSKWLLEPCKSEEKVNG